MHHHLELVRTDVDDVKLCVGHFEGVIAPRDRRGSNVSTASSVVGHSKAERLGGLEIDHQFVLGRRLSRQNRKPMLAPDGRSVPPR
jgi:hypothetical protein